MSPSSDSGPEAGGPPQPELSNGPWLVVGLGNVGARYIGTRHNVGFEVLDAFASRHGGGVPKKSWKHSEAASLRAGAISGVRGAVIACWPTTFMNLSGDAVQELNSFYHISPANLIVAHDDIDLPCGTLRIKKGGGDGGQKGIRSIIERTGSADFVRIKVGVGRPPDPRFEVADWVLSRFSKEERGVVDKAVQGANEAVVMVMERGLKEAQNQFNRSFI